MHILNGKYTDENENYRCFVELQGGEPYILLNLEHYFANNKKNESHCDLLYIIYQINDKKWRAFLIELKDIHEKNFLSDKKSQKTFRKRIIQKFENSANKLNTEILNFLNLKRRNTRVIALLVVPSEINALVKRLGILDMNKKKNSNIDEWKISSCNTPNNLWSG